MIELVIGMLATFTWKHLREKNPGSTFNLSDFADAGLKACEDTKVVLQRVGLYPKDEEIAAWTKPFAAPLGVGRRKTSRKKGRKHISDHR